MCEGPGEKIELLCNGTKKQAFANIYISKVFQLFSNWVGLFPAFFLENLICSSQWGCYEVWEGLYTQKAQQYFSMDAIGGKRVTY